MPAVPILSFVSNAIPLVFEFLCFPIGALSGKPTVLKDTSGIFIQKEKETAVVKVNDALLTTSM